jgi:hypothetical protein
VSWSATADEYIAALAAVDIRATLDPRKLNPPMVLVVPPDLERHVASGLYAAWTFHLCVPGPADLDAVKWLLDNIEAAFDAVGAFTAEFSTLTITPDADPLPAYTITSIAIPL